MSMTYQISFFCCVVVWSGRLKVNLINRVSTHGSVEKLLNRTNNLYQPITCLNHDMMMMIKKCETNETRFMLEKLTFVQLVLNR